MRRQLLAFPIARAAEEGGQKRLAYFLARKGLYQTDISALLGKSADFLGNLKRREFKDFVKHCAAHREYPELEAAVLDAEQTRDEDDQALTEVQADLKKLRESIRMLREMRRDRASSQAEIAGLQARIDELILRLGMADLRQMPQDFDPVAAEDDGKDHDGPADELED